MYSDVKGNKNKKRAFLYQMPSNCQCCFHVNIFFMTRAVLLYLYHVILPVRKHFDFISSVDCGCMPACLRARSTVANVSEWESMGETGLLKPTVSFLNFTDQKLSNTATMSQ